MRSQNVFAFFSIALVLSVPAFCQTSDAEQTATSKVQSVREDPVLGAGDELTIAAPDIDELDNRVLKVLADGSVSVPLLGSIQAAGLTADQLQDTINQKLKSQFRRPHISFSQVEIASKPVTVLGAVNDPGVVQADGRRRLLEVISMAGGLRKDAGPTLTIARKTTSLATFPEALRPKLQGKYVVASVPVDGLMEGSDPAANVLVSPGDVVTVPKGQLVYVVGDVNRAGGFMIGESNDLTVLKAISLAEGLKETAKASHALILRTDASGKRTEEPLDLNKLLAGKSEDQTLKANDILFVPSSTAKKIADRSIRALIDGGTGVLVYRH
jgi:polysaccharide export outer membrane protein